MTKIAHFISSEIFHFAAAVHGKKKKQHSGFFLGQCCSSEFKCLMLLAFFFLPIIFYIDVLNVLSSVRLLLPLWRPPLVWYLYYNL